MSVARAINRVKSAPRPVRVPLKGKGGHSTLPVSTRPNHPTDRGLMRKNGSKGTLDTINRIKNRPRAAVLAARKTKVLGAIEKMKAEPGKHYSFATQDRLMREARNRKWIK